MEINTGSAGSSAVELYGSFHLGQTELALPVAALQEVVNYPAAVTSVPLAPSHLLGLFNLRGTLIPIVRPLITDIRSSIASVSPCISMLRYPVSLLATPN